jgi:hypothetical protein
MGLIEIGYDEANILGKPRRDCACQHAGARGGFQDMPGIRAGDPGCKAGRVGLEDEGDQEPIVYFGNRPGEDLVRRYHGSSLERLPPASKIPETRSRGTAA